MTPEGLIKRQICDYLTRCGVFFWVQSNGAVFDPTRKIFRKKRSKYEIKGVADILGVLDGRLLCIEVKSATGRLSPEQKAFLNQVNNRGGIAFMARSVEDIIEGVRLGQTNANVRY